MVRVKILTYCLVVSLLCLSACSPEEEPQPPQVDTGQRSVENVWPVQATRVFGSETATATILAVQADEPDANDAFFANLAGGGAWLSLAKSQLQASNYAQAMDCSRAGLDELGDRYVDVSQMYEFTLKRQYAHQVYETGEHADGAKLTVKMLEELWWAAQRQHGVADAALSMAEMTAVEQPEDAEAGEGAGASKRLKNAKAGRRKSESKVFLKKKKRLSGLGLGWPSPSQESARYFGLAAVAMLLGLSLLMFRKSSKPLKGHAALLAKLQETDPDTVGDDETEEVDL